MPRFTLDETAAANLIAAAAAYYGSDALPPGVDLPEEMPWITDSYSADAEAENFGVTTDLVSAMLAAGILADSERPQTSPALWFVYEPFDGTSAGYRWTLAVGDGSYDLTVTDGFNEADSLGQDRELKGVGLAMAVLREAVAAGNRIATALDRYAANKQNCRRPEPRPPATEEIVEVRGGLFEPEFRIIIERILQQPRERWKNSDRYVFSSLSRIHAESICRYLRSLGVAYDRATVSRWSP
jgi:hypothetical protein